MMDSFEALKIISQHRGDAIVITTMTSQFEWPQISTRPELDMSPGTMGMASSLGLGLAIARPERKVIVLDGDGSLLMNLGSLVTIANLSPSNYIHFVFQNGVYRTTGGQPIPLAGKIDFGALARGAVFTNVHTFKSLSALEGNLGTIMKKKGPAFICLEVPALTERPPFKLVKTGDIIDRFKAALRSS